MKRSFSLFIILLCFLATSCSQINYISSDNIPTYISPKENHNRKASHIGKRDFYLWGLVPTFHTVNVDDELADDGLISAARIEVREYQEFMDVFWTYVTLGMFKTVRFEISGYGVRQ